MFKILSVCILGSCLFLGGCKDKPSSDKPQENAVNPQAEQRAKELANRAVCGANMLRIVEALQIYATTHGDAFPADMNALVRDGSLTPKFLACPSSGEPYVYVYPNKGSNTPGEAIILYEPLHNHHAEGINIAYADCHVVWMSADEARKALAAQGLKVVE